MVIQRQATTPSDAFWALDPFSAVSPAEPWYADLESHFIGHPYGVRRALVNKLKPSTFARQYRQTALVGLSRTGKSTMVRGAMKDLDAFNLRPIYVDALSSFDQGTFTFADVLFVIARACLATLEGEGVKGLPKEEFDAVKLWFADDLSIESSGFKKEFAAEAGVEAGAGVPFLGKFFARLTASLKADNSYRREIREQGDRDPQLLTSRVNLLLDGAQKALSEKLGREIEFVVVFDNLEKINNDTQVNETLIRRAEDLRAIHAHLVLFLSLFNQHAPLEQSANDVFDVVPIPALPIRRQTDEHDFVSAEALSAVRDIVSRRVNLDDVFTEADECLRRALRASGGRLGDFMYVLRRACEEADPGKVTPEVIDRAIGYLQSFEYGTKVRRDDWPRLREIADQHKIEPSERDRYLLVHSLVLNYNGNGTWWDVHPLVRADRRFAP